MTIRLNIDGVQAHSVLCMSDLKVIICFGSVMYYRFIVAFTSLSGMFGEPTFCLLVTYFVDT